MWEQVEFLTCTVNSLVRVLTAETDCLEFARTECDKTKQSPTLQEIGDSLVCHHVFVDRVVLHADSILHGNVLLPPDREVAAPGGLELNCHLI